MTEQVADRSDRLAEAIQTCGVLAVVSGSGMGELFESLGALALDGGGTLNPSTYELLAAIHEVSAEEIVVLPNSPNVIMAAERAARGRPRRAGPRGRAADADRGRARPAGRRRRRRPRPRRGRRRVLARRPARLLVADLRRVDHPTGPRIIIDGRGPHGVRQQ